MCIRTKDEWGNIEKQLRSSRTPVFVRTILVLGIREFVRNKAKTLDALPSHDPNREKERALFGDECRNLYVLIVSVAAQVKRRYTTFKSPVNQGEAWTDQRYQVLFQECDETRYLLESNARNF